MKYLIIPGLAKSGTTYLFDQLSQNEEYFTPTMRKEVNYFCQGDDILQYNSQYPSLSEEKWHVDASPAYMESYVDEFTRMKSAFNGEIAKFIVCLREPFSRAYSHYLHDLKRHVVHFDFNAFMTLSHNIKSIDSFQKYFIPRKPQIEYLIKLFGRENVLGFDLGTKREKWRHTTELEDFLSISGKIHFDSGKVSNPGGWIPRIFYDRKRSLEVYDRGEVYALPPGTLLIKNGTDSMLLKDFPESMADKLIKSSQYWSMEFIPDELGDMSGAIWDDYLESMELLGLEVKKPQPEKAYTAHEPNLSPTIKERLEKISSVENDLSHIWTTRSDKAAFNAVADKMADRHFAGGAVNRIRRSDSPLETALETVNRFDYLPQAEASLVVECLRQKNFNLLLQGRVLSPVNNRFLSEDRVKSLVMPIIKGGEISVEKLRTLAHHVGLSYAGRLTTPSIPVSMKKGEEVCISVDIENLTNKNWLPYDGGKLNVSYHWYDSTGAVCIFDGLRTPIDEEVMLGQPLRISNVKIKAPELPGAYTLEITMVREGVSWLERKGFISEKKELRVSS
ncbi:hypothetical protein FWJ25_04645 [Marinobacter salinexigens]|uniref:Sulfotransferase domain-containing protein n=1 Tax=Marinobacter salinexigens TaxID=2919747 RepID=A0A5B0VK45_9GAMM|nr:hypothetical protein [Marinobacter salinexigens]KAA1174683.1 hypothetical protein FWJ25_04645 [Marinobacter salinexigens]